MLRIRWCDLRLANDKSCCCNGAWPGPKFSGKLLTFRIGRLEIVQHEKTGSDNCGCRDRSRSAHDSQRADYDDDGR